MPQASQKLLTSNSYFLTPLQSHSCRKQLDELAGNTGAAAAGTDGEGFALDEQLIRRHLHAVLLGKIQQNFFKPAAGR